MREREVPRQVNRRGSRVSPYEVISGGVATAGLVLGIVRMGMIQSQVDGPDPMSVSRADYTLTYEKQHNRVIKLEDNPCEVNVTPRTVSQAAFDAACEVERQQQAAEKQAGEAIGNDPLSILAISTIIVGTGSGVIAYGVGKLLEGRE